MPTSPPKEATPRVLACSASDDWMQRVQEALAGASLAVVSAACSAEALAALTGEGAALVVIDSALKDASGLALCRQVRETPAISDTPVLFVSRLAGEMDRVLCFESGADDFLADPFFARELRSRVRAVLRRGRAAGRGTPGHEPTRLGEVTLDLRRSRVEVDGRRVDLTARELEILRTLIRRQGRVVRREELLEGIVGDEVRTPRLVDTHVKSIRRKLGSARGQIQTVRGVGYRFTTED